MPIKRKNLKRKSTCDKDDPIDSKNMNVVEEKDDEMTKVQYPGTEVANSNPEMNGLLKKWNTKLVSWNINGLRAVLKSKSFGYLTEENADIIGLQETKCSQSDIPTEAKDIDGYTAYWSSAEKNGYAGTGILSKKVPLNVTYGIGKKEHDQEGRVITAEYESIYFVTAYVPNSGRGLVRLKYREKEWDRDFAAYLKNLDKKKPVVVCGDLNVAHLEIDLSNPKSNKKSAGFTKEERDSFSSILESVDLIDSFRQIYPDRKNAYTFWSYMGNARAKNVGWRLDYFLISRRLLPRLCNHELRTAVKGSDHCPIVLFLNL